MRRQLFLIFLTLKLDLDVVGFTATQLHVKKSKRGGARVAPPSYFVNWGPTEESFATFLIEEQAPHKTLCRFLTGHSATQL